MAKISNLSKFFGLVRASTTETNALLNVRTLAAKHIQRRPSRINSKLAIALAGLVAVAGINNQLVSVAHADDSIPTNNNNNGGGGGGGGDGGGSDIPTLPPVIVPGYIPPSVYPTQITLGPGAGYTGPMIEPVGIGPSGGGSIHTPASKAPTSKKTQNSNPCPDNQGDPIMMSTGNKAVSVMEFSLPGEMGLTFERFYNSKFLGTTDNAGTWADSIDFLLSGTNCNWIGQTGVPGRCSAITFIRPDGSQISFPTTNPTPLANGLDTVNSFPNVGPFTAVATATLTYNANGTYTVQDEDSHALTFNASGQLLTIKDLAGVGWTVSHPNQSTTVVTHTSGQSYSIVQTQQSGNNIQVQVTDPASNVYTYQSSNTQPGLSSIGLINSVTYPGSPTTTVSYKYQQAPGNSIANELTEVDYNGVAHDLTTYDSNGKANSTSMADGTQKTSIVYSSNSTGPVATVTNPLGHVTVYQYNSSGLLTSVTGNASAHCSASYASVTYDSNGNMASSTDNNGNVIKYTYSANGLLQQTIESPGAYQRVTNYTWDPTPGTDRLQSVTVVGYQEMSFAYNAQGRPQSTTTTNLTSNGVANQTQTTTYSYALASNGMVTSKTITLPSPNNANTITYNYNSDGFQTSVKNALGQSTTYSNITGNGLAQTVTSANGDVSNYTFNAGRLTTTSHAHNGTTYTKYYYYDANSQNLSRVVDYDGESTSYSYDADFKLTSSTWTGPSGASIVKAYSYDANGDVTGTSWTRGGLTSPDYTTHTSYDELGRAIVKSGNNSQSRTITYDPNGNISTVTDTASNVTKYKYDSDNRIQYVIDANGKSTLYQYDFGDQPLATTDSRGLVTNYSYDGFGQLWAVSIPDSGKTSFSHDAYGRLSSRTYNNGVATTYTYDTLNRVTSMAAGSQTYEYTYDSCTYGLGHLCSYAGENGGGSSTLTYTIEGLVNTRTDRTFLGSSVTTFNYDEMNRLTQMINGSSYTVNYGWTDDQVTNVGLQFSGQNGSVVSNVKYDAMRRPISWTYGNGIVRTQTYDQDERLTSIKSMLSSTAIQNLTYSWDNVDRITGITNSVYPSASQTFGYDNLYRLTSQTGPAPIALTYDTNGNRTAQNWMTNDAVSIPSTNNRVTSRGSHSYTYDGNGNRATDTVNDVTTTYAYDGFNRLNSVARSASLTNCETNYQCPAYPSGTTTYQVDGLGRTVFRNGPLGLWLYGYGLNGELISEATAPPSGSVNVNWYIYLNGQPVGLLNQIGSATPVLYYMHDDHLGRPEEITNSGGSVVWRAQNYGFDRAIVTNGIADVDIGLPGQVYDSNTGNWSNGFRDYDSSDGRYLESDPIGLNGGVNTYAYVNNNPITNVDSLGLRADTDLCAGLTAKGCMQIGSNYAPDYVELSVTVPSVFSFSYTLTRTGAVFSSGGFTFGTPKSIASGKNWGFSIMGGFLLNPCHTGQNVNDLVNGGSLSGSFYDGVGGGFVHNSSGTAIEMGFGLGGLGAGYSYAQQTGQLGIHW